MLAASPCCVDTAVLAKFRAAREQSQAVGKIMSVRCFILLCGHGIASKVQRSKKQSQAVGKSLVSACCLSLLCEHSIASKVEVRQQSHGVGKIVSAASLCCVDAALQAKFRAARGL